MCPVNMAELKDSNLSCDNRSHSRKIWQQQDKNQQEES